LSRLNADAMMKLRTQQTSLQHEDARALLALENADRLHPQLALAETRRFRKRYEQDIALKDLLSSHQNQGRRLDIMKDVIEDRKNRAEIVAADDHQAELVQSTLLQRMSNQPATS
jgi:hypothetical protein